MGRSAGVDGFAAPHQPVTEGDRPHDLSVDQAGVWALMAVATDQDPGIASDLFDGVEVHLCESLSDDMDKVTRPSATMNHPTVQS